MAESKRDSEAIQKIRLNIWSQLVAHFKAHRDKPVDFFGKDYNSPEFVRALEPMLARAGVDLSDKGPESFYYECMLYAAEWWDYCQSDHVQVKPRPEN